MFTLLGATIAGLTLSHAARATAYTLHSSVIFSLYGDRTPILSPGDFVLTSLGAQQLYDSGAAFRARYIASPAENKAHNFTESSPILGISTNNIDNSQIYVAAVDLYHVVNSAQAFLQGLYPAIGFLTSSPFLPSESVLANGTAIDYPLNGYQYCPVHTYRPTDPNLIWLAGDINCEEYLVSAYKYYSSDEFMSIENSTQPFYQDIAAKGLRGIPPNTIVGYYNAYDIYDYVNYGYTHNASVRENISSDELVQLRALASRQMFDLNGNKSASGIIEGDMIRTIAGQTLAAKVLGLLEKHVDSKGVLGQLSVMFGDLEPFLAFFALSGLSNVNSNFKGLPNLGSAMVFELFSLDSDNQTYPSESDLWVRFLFRNGTSDDQNLIAYSLFGEGRSNTDMKWTDFQNQMANFMRPKVRDWCNTCASISTFCAFYTGNFTFSDGLDSPSHEGLTPQVAGVIGAAVTLAVVGLAVAAMFLGGIRFSRTSSRRRSELGGFKGSQKLASDADLTSGKAPTSVMAARGHERVGSWELGENKAEEHGFGSLHRPRDLPPHDGDDISVNPMGEPVKVDDRV
ncbi:hypothetical protein FGG08_004376 [Glutinoglossum americanum]|uniref:Phosphoglycerate mutase-like protein n=1 Tax=Glutinoglossum americanum TaxID=1670608 RepID=A0A9P8I7P9_9PEZI|nr:hypothetical protein FGG08_004376 [Glutinoglossum americanum]